jgi:NADH-quinone oxidoreductase subunit E
VEEKMDIVNVNKIIEKYQEKRTALISILHDIQDRYQFLPEEALKIIASRLRMNLSEIYGVVTFYKSFSLIPKGKHSITICLGTACHVRGGPKILREMRALLKIEPGETTPDRKFSLNTVNCLGVCAIGPVMMIDGKFYGDMSPLKAKRMIEKLSKNTKKSGGRS